ISPTGKGAFTTSKFESSQVPSAPASPSLTSRRAHSPEFSTDASAARRIAALEVSIASVRREIVDGMEGRSVLARALAEEKSAADQTRSRLRQALVNLCARRDRASAALEHNKERFMSATHA